MGCKGGDELRGENWQSWTKKDVTKRGKKRKRGEQVSLEVRGERGDRTYAEREIETDRQTDSC